MERQRDGEIKDTFHDLTGNVCKRDHVFIGEWGKGGGGEEGEGQRTGLSSIFIASHTH